MRLGDDEIIYITCLNGRIHFSIEKNRYSCENLFVDNRGGEIGRSASPKHNKRNGM